MKVLFAVNNEKVAESITRKYQEEYKEIISSKTVYYYNAILKELQKDKTYDRIVIGEDLEPFASDNYQAIDKYIFEKMDAISDEATNIEGDNIPIILISLDRRTKNDPLLLKLFGLGLYDVLVGQDRSIQKVCSLMYKPRSKKEAKAYYKVEAENVSYEAEKSNGVSESEIQNILNHYKKIGNNIPKCVQSFESINSQYSKEQIKLIIEVLPVNVKVILEENSDTYRKIMGIKGKKIAGTSKLREQDYVEKEINTGSKLTKPVIIPTTVSTKNVMKVKKGNEELVKQNSNKQKNKNIEAETKRKEQERIKKEKEEAETKRKEQERIAKEKEETEIKRKEQERMKKEKEEAETKRKEQERMKKEKAVVEAKKEEDEIIQPVKRGRGRPRKTPIVVEEEVVPIKRKRGRPRKKDDETEENENLELLKNNDSETDNNFEDNFDIIDEDNYELDNIVIEENDELGIEEDEEVNEEELLPGFDDYEEESEEDYDFIEDEDFDLDIYESEEENDELGIEEENEEDILPGFNDYEEELEEDNDFIEDEEDYDFIEDENEEIESLPGFEDEETDYDLLEDENDELVIEEDNEEDNEEDVLPGFDDYEQESQEEQEDNDFIEDEEDYDFIEDEEDNDFIEDEDEEIEFLPEFEDEETESLPGFEDEELELEDVELDLEEEVLPGFDDTEEEIPLKQHNGSFSGINNRNYKYDNNLANSIKDLKETESIETYNVETDNLITGNQKIVSFVGTTKNGTSFVVNNLAEMLSNQGIKTAILDLTKNKNSYYIYTNNEEELRQIAHNSFEKLAQGTSEGIPVNKNLSVFTSLPGNDESLDNVTNIIQTLLENFTVVLMDCDFGTDPRYFKAAQEIYLVQSLDVLTIQPLTAFLRDLKVKGILEPYKLRIVINKNIKVNSLNDRILIGGMSVYNDPGMTYMTELFDKETIKFVTIPFESQVYVKYLEGLVNCKISSKGYSKNFLTSLKNLSDMVYPTLNVKKQKNYNDYSKKSKKFEDTFSKNTSSILDKMKKKY